MDSHAVVSVIQYIGDEVVFLTLKDHPLIGGARSRHQQEPEDYKCSFEAPLERVSTDDFNKFNSKTSPQSV